MRNNYREDGFVWFEDQISEMADLLITVQGIRFIYLKKRDRSWIERIGDDGMRFALMNMSEIQLRMIEELIGRRVQKVEVHLNFVGKPELPEPEKDPEQEIILL